MDFTVKRYKQLLLALQNANYQFQTFEEFLIAPKEGKVIILRHDVDKIPMNSLKFAEIQRKHYICGSYYFRAVPCSWNEKIIKDIHSLGHEIGYHYESLTTCGGNMKRAYSDFVMNLNRLKQMVPVTTICMHGSPTSKYDSKDIWKKYTYKDLGIIGEPYFDVDFSKMFYLTDTGRRWDGYKVSLRDKIEEHQDRWNVEGLIYHSTKDIIKAIETNKLPSRVMITMHPQRWSNNFFDWIKELVLQNAKNIIKRLINKIKNNK